MGEGKHILVTGPTHTSINNCLNAITKHISSPYIIKVGEKSQATEILDNPAIVRKTRYPVITHMSGICQSSTNSNVGKMSEIMAKHKSTGVVIGATPFALCYPASKKLEGWSFDYVIIDEAAQMSIPLALAAMAYGEKVIFVGDHKQLDPIVPTGTGNWLFSKSVFKHLIDCYPSDATLLDTSYRLSPSLVKIPSTLFYGGKIKSRRDSDNKEFTKFNCKEYPELINNPSNEILFIHHEFDTLGRSPYEAKITSSIVSDLLDNGIPISQIAMITPYRAQVREIKKALVENNVLSEERLTEAFIDTIERMQGQEKSYVIFSLSNSNPAEVEDRLQFFYSANRLNVAITRATTKCIVLANEKVFNLCSSSKDNKESDGALQYGMASFWNYYLASSKVYAKADDSEW